MSNLNGLGYELRWQNAKSDAQLLSRLLNDGIIEGCTLTFTGTSITVGAGHFICAGRPVQVTAADTINLTGLIATGFVRLKYKIDLTQTADLNTFTQGSWTYDTAATIGAFTALTQENINAPGTTYNTYEIEFAIYTLASSVVTGLYRQLTNISYTGIKNIVSWGGNAVANGQTNCIAWEDERNVYINIDYICSTVTNGLASPATVCTLPSGIRLPSVTLTKRSIVVTTSAMLDATFSLSGAGVISVITSGNASYYSGTVNFVYPKGI